MGIGRKTRSCLALCAAAAILWMPSGQASAFSWFKGRAAAERRVMPGGSAVGISVATEGVTVIGLTDLDGKSSPAEEAGLRIGDVIRSVDGLPVSTVEALQSVIGEGRERDLRVLRDGRDLHLALRPAAGQDGVYRMGAWVQDGAAGIGTLTFYDAARGRYGALGHAICDGDTMQPTPITGGQLEGALIRGVRKSEPGAPGELLGSLDGKAVGSVERNTEFGVFGAMTEPFVNPLYPEGVEILPREEVKEGPAVILSTVEDSLLKAYDCEIVTARHQSRPETRSLLIRVTDEDLLRRTGGIVQGMSGSPILQNGKLAGAVTHVCLNDPACGYGIYIDWMLDEAAPLTEAA